MCVPGGMGAVRVGAAGAQARSGWKKVKGEETSVAAVELTAPATDGCLASPPARRVAVSGL